MLINSDCYVTITVDCGSTSMINMSARQCVLNTVYDFTLIPAARSWAKVIFSEACVKNSVHKGGGVRSKLSGGVFKFFFLFFFFNFFSPKKFLRGYGQCAAGTHPTGMHSC